MKRLVLLAALQFAPACSSESAPLPLTPGECTADYTAQGAATWVSVKNGTFPVIGTQAITGSLNGPAAELAGNTIRLRLAFDPFPETGVEIRNSRIAQYIFGPDALGFEATYIRSAEGTASGKLPASGETANVTLAGVFYVAGGRVPVDVPVYVSAVREGEYEVRSHPGGLPLDLRTQLNVSKGLDEMLALVNATVDPKVTVQFALTLKKACQ